MEYQIPQIEIKLKQIKLKAATRKLRDCFRGMKRKGEKTFKLYPNLKWHGGGWNQELVNDLDAYYGTDVNMGEVLVDLFKENNEGVLEK